MPHRSRRISTLVDALIRAARHGEPPEVLIRLADGRVEPLEAALTVAASDGPDGASAPVVARLRNALLRCREGGLRS